MASDNDLLLGAAIAAGIGIWALRKPLTQLTEPTGQLIGAVASGAQSIASWVPASTGSTGTAKTFWQTLYALTPFGIGPTITGIRYPQVWT